MPRRRATARRRPAARKKAAPKKKSYRRRGGYLKPNVPGQIGFPKNRIVKMRYNDRHLIDADNTGAASAYTYRCNSIFDPNFTGVGHQPLGHDQWQTFYTQYMVIGSKMSVIFRSSTNSTTNNLIGVYPATSSTALTDPTAIIEQGLGRYSNLQMITNGNTKTITMSWSAKKWFNTVDLRDNWDDYGANFGANPVEEAFYHIWTALGIAGGVDPPATDVYVTIDYIVLLADPKTLAQS